MKIEINSQLASNPYGWGIIKPDSYGNKPAMAVIWCHGAAGRGDGSEAGIKMVLDTQVPPKLKEAVDRFNIVVLFPQYSTATDLGCLDKMIQEARALSGVDISRIYLMCFSMGGELVTRWLSASASRASLVAGSINIGGLNVIDTTTEAQYIVSEKVPMVFFHSTSDPSSSVKNTQTAVDTINAAGPVIPAKAVYYNSNLHDITNQVCDADVFPFRGTETVNNIYEWMLLNSNDKPIGVPETGGPVVPIPVVDSFTTTEAKIKLDGSKSRNVNRDKCRWEKVSVAQGVSIWDVNTCNWINCDLTLPKEGVYIFRFVAVDDKGQSATKDITVTYSKSSTPTQSVPKVLKSINLIGYWLLFTDGSRVQAVEVIQDLSTGKTTYKVSDSEQYTV